MARESRKSVLSVRLDEVVRACTHTHTHTHTHIYIYTAWWVRYLWIFVGIQDTAQTKEKITNFRFGTIFYSFFQFLLSIYLSIWWRASGSYHSSFNKNWKYPLFICLSFCFFFSFPIIRISMSLKWTPVFSPDCYLFIPFPPWHVILIQALN